ncbi:hypothetical protein SAMN05421539_103374 [Jannaschia seohaensis]|uniref:Uncharacterized protein n=1 Tax=Jannaschia seohaensis TaxID=475081 RepID=A0A2Y9AJH3_9RHOB|nr:hypothetical protein BCF38_103374 [Jannaschia seohaensis]SSA44651.1 hypothetical protein SAMN05421539_103374 [Jannaschia seohaensis]
MKELRLLLARQDGLMLLFIRPVSPVLRRVVGLSSVSWPILMLPLPMLA